MFRPPGGADGWRKNTLPTYGGVTDGLEEIPSLSGGYRPFIAKRPLSLPGVLAVFGKEAPLTPGGVHVQKCEEVPSHSGGGYTDRLAKCRKICGREWRDNIA